MLVLVTLALRKKVQKINGFDLILKHVHVITRLDYQFFRTLIIIFNISQFINHSKITPSEHSADTVLAL